VKIQREKNHEEREREFHYNSGKLQWWVVLSHELGFLGLTDLFHIGRGMLFIQAVSVMLSVG